jgi:hypothetical protein
MTQVQLVESIGGSPTLTGKRWRARIIEGDRWGSSAYYPKDVLERDGARVFPTGLAMYLNHPSESEQWERPERSVQDMVGKLTSDAVYESDGLYADVEFYDSFVSQINERAEDVGLSIRATGLTEDAEMDGRYGPVITALLAADSVDVVTKAGAGGKLTSILESDRNLAGEPINKKGTQSVADVTKEDFEALRTALTEAIAGIPAALAESLAAVAPVVEEPVVEEEADEEDDDKEEAVVIDHAAVVEALRANNLPAASAAKIVAALTEGATLEAAVQEQIDLREAFVSTSESGTVVITESASKVSGLARAVTVLG